MLILELSGGLRAELLQGEELPLQLRGEGSNVVPLQVELVRGLTQGGDLPGDTSDLFVHVLLPLLEVLCFLACALPRRVRLAETLLCLLMARLVLPQLNGLLGDEFVHHV